MRKIRDSCNGVVNRSKVVKYLQIDNWSRKQWKRRDNVRTEKEKLTFLHLNDDVLLKIYSYLDWMDARRLSQTCGRLLGLNFWIYKKNVEFDLDEYTFVDLSDGKIRVKNSLIEYGPYIHVLKTSVANINKVVAANCTNVKSLRIHHNHHKFNMQVNPFMSLAIRGWIRNLKLESLRLWDSEYNEHFYDVAGLKEIYVCGVDVPKFLLKNGTLERLSVGLPSQPIVVLDYNIFSPLHHLKCLHVDNSHMNVDEVMKFTKFDGITEFSIYYPKHEVNPLNTFLIKLAEKAKLDKLSVKTSFCTFINEDTFRALQLFNLNALSLPYFSSNHFIQFIRENQAPRLKHLKLNLRHWSLQDVLVLTTIIVENWMNVKIICCSLSEVGYNQFDQSFTNEILNKSTKRTPLTLEVHSYGYEDASWYTKRTTVSTYQ